MLDGKEIARRLKAAMLVSGITSAVLAEKCGVTAQAVNGWRKTGRVHKRHLGKIAELTGRDLLTGAEAPKAPATTSAREEMLLLLFSGLFAHQQRELLLKLHALFEANQITRKELGLRELRGVSDAQVEAAFKAVPVPAKGTRSKGRTAPGRNPDAAMDDFPEG